MFGQKPQGGSVCGRGGTVGEEGEIPQRGPVRKTHKLIQQQFQSISEQRWEKFLHQWAQEEEQVHRSREGRNNKSRRERGGGKKTLDSNLQIKKAKQSIMSESPHSWLLLPGSCRMKQDKTRICKLVPSLRMAGELWWWWRRGEDKWAFQGTTQRPVKSLLSQTLINHRSRSY